MFHRSAKHRLRSGKSLEECDKINSPPCVIFLAPQVIFLGRRNVKRKRKLRKSFDKGSTREAQTLERQQEIKVNYKGGLI